MPYDPPARPATTIRVGSGDRAAILLIQRRLNELGCGPLDEDGLFGCQTQLAVRLFQARFTDNIGLIDYGTGELP